MPYMLEGTYCPPYALCEEANALHLEMLSQRNPEVVATYTRDDDSWDLKLVDFGGLDVYYVEEDGLIQYCVEVAEFDIPQYAVNTLVQTSVWRNKAHDIRGIAKWVFFEVLFAKYQTIISDESQSIDGKNFWGWRVDDAIALGYHVYIVGLYGSVAFNTVSPFGPTKIQKAREMKPHYTANADRSGKYYRFMISRDAIEEN